MEKTSAVAKGLVKWTSAVAEELGGSMPTEENWKEICRSVEQSVEHLGGLTSAIAEGYAEAESAKSSDEKDCRRKKIRFCTPPLWM